MKKLEQLTHYWRWQFLRLNEDYQLNYDLLVDSIRATAKKFRTLKKVNEYIKIEIDKTRDEFYNNYGITLPYDYRRKDLPGGLCIEGEADFAVRKGSLQEIFAGKHKSNEVIGSEYLFETRKKEMLVEVWKGYGKEKRDNPVIYQKYIGVVINFDAELGDIKKEIEKLVKQHQNVRRNFLNIKRPRTPIKDSILRNYEIYLRVWDLFKKGLPNAEIAQKVFPCDTGGKRNTEKKVNDCLKRARALISGEYRNIIFY